LFPEFQGPGDLRKNFGRPARASHDDGSVAQDSSHTRLFDGDAFDSLKKKLNGTAIHDSRLYDDSLIGDGHFRGVAAHEANTKKHRSESETYEGNPIHDVAWGRNFDSLPTRTRTNQRYYCNEHEDCSDQRMAHHYDPVQPRFILHGFAGDEVLFGVAQEVSWNGVMKKLARGKSGSDVRWMLQMVKCYPAQSRKL
jgi:hypothetical protein